MVFDLRIILNYPSDKTTLNYIYFKHRNYILKSENYSKEQSKISKEWNNFKYFSNYLTGERFSLKSLRYLENVGIIFIQ